MSNHNPKPTIYHLPSTNRGFTLVEMMIIAPIVILVIGIFISALVSMTGSVLSSRGASALAYDIQDALNRIDADVKASGGYLATNNITLSTGQGYDNGTSAFKNADATNGTMLILNTYATTANPLSSTRNFVYATGQPNACGSTLVSQNTKVAMNIVYFVKDNTLWRRVIAPSNYLTVGCSVPWQRPSCVPGYNPATFPFCKTEDTKLVDGIGTGGFTVNYYTSADSTTPIANASNNTLSDNARQAALQTASSVSVRIDAVKTLAGRSVSRSGSIRTTSPNDSSGVIANGLVLNFDAANPVSYPGTGIVWTDLSGNGNNGTLINGVGYSATNGGALVFDGVDDYVNCGNFGNFYNQGTISFWMNPTVVENYRDPFTTNYNGGVATNAGIRFEEHAVDTPPNFGVIIGNDAGTYGGGDYYLTSGLIANNWYYVTLVWNVSTGNITGYMNGVSMFNQTHALWPTTMPSVTIGEGFSNARYWKGPISVVQIYNRALTSTEITQNFNALRGRYGL